jgi:hypothetical protein
LTAINLRDNRLKGKGITVIPQTDKRHLQIFATSRNP